MQSAARSVFLSTLRTAAAAAIWVPSAALRATQRAAPLSAAWHWLPQHATDYISAATAQRNDSVTTKRSTGLQYLLYINASREIKHLLHQEGA